MNKGIATIIKWTNNQRTTNKNNPMQNLQTKHMVEINIDTSLQHNKYFQRQLAVAGGTIMASKKGRTKTILKMKTRGWHQQERKDIIENRARRSCIEEKVRWSIWRDEFKTWPVQIWCIFRRFTWLEALHCTKNALAYCEQLQPMQTAVDMQDRHDETLIKGVFFLQKLREQGSPTWRSHWSSCQNAKAKNILSIFFFISWAGWINYPNLSLTLPPSNPCIPPPRLHTAP